MMKAILVGIGVLLVTQVLAGVVVIGLVPQYPAALDFFLMASHAIASLATAALAPNYNFLAGSMIVIPSAVIFALANLVYENFFGIKGDFHGIEGATTVAQLALLRKESCG